jgi:hypothetical protein
MIFLNSANAGVYSLVADKCISKTGLRLLLLIPKLPKGNLETENSAQIYRSVCQFHQSWMCQTKGHTQVREQCICASFFTVTTDITS